MPLGGFPPLRRWCRCVAPARGITDGVQVALCLALGADLVGMAAAVLRPALESAEALLSKLRVVLRQLRIAMFCTGARTVRDLNQACLVRRGGGEECLRS